MSLRAIPTSFDPAAVAAIDARLDAVERDEGARILWAAESGSRAWGFPSPDSDYDGRFIYVRHRDAYLSRWPPRDVIETPLDKLLDVNGWDLAKALKLLLKGNAVVLEWLTSPIVYRGDPAFRDAMLALARRHGDRRGLARHYLHLGERQRALHMPNGGKDVGVKKLFYVLRPAAALRWLRTHPGEIVLPMHLPTLIAEGESSTEVRGGGRADRPQGGNSGRRAGRSLAGADGVYRRGVRTGGSWCGRRWPSIKQERESGGRCAIQSLGRVEIALSP